VALDVFADKELASVDSEKRAHGATSSYD